MDKSNQNSQNNTDDMNNIFAEANKAVNQFINDILKSNISLEGESLIMNYFVQIFINKLKEVIEKNLKNKGGKINNELRVLAEKTRELLYQTKSNKKLNHSTQTNLDKTIDNLSIYFNMFSIND